MNLNEERLIKWQFRLMNPESFYYTLIKAMYLADDTNFMLLKLGFDELGTAIQRYKSEEGYWPKLVEEYNKTHNTDLEY